MSVGGIIKEIVVFFSDAIAKDIIKNVNPNAIVKNPDSLSFFNIKMPPINTIIEAITIIEIIVKGLQE